MCGRFALHTPLAVLLEQFEALAPEPHELEPRYNVAPTQPVPAVRDVGAGRQLAVVRWGLVTPWSEGPDGKGPLLINARGETASERPSFRTALRRRRCLVPADGFYEWERIGRRRLPLYFSDPEERPSRWARSGSAGPVGTRPRWSRARS